MITQICGKLVEKTPTFVVIDCSGVGYFLHISLQTFSALPDNEYVCLFSHLSIRDDAHTLYGFFTKIERDLFRLLISVSGVGPSTARTMLSSISSKEVQNAIISENITLIQSVKGIGAKTARRIVIDLKENVLKTFAVDQVSPSTNNTIKEEALSALEVLGFNRRQSEKAINEILKQSPYETVELLIKKALKNL